MATFVLIHGAGDSAWHWHLVEPELRALGHDLVTMDLPCEDDSAGLEEYAATVVEAIGERRNLVVVAQSFGGFTAPLVCERVSVELMVLVTAMIPAPGEAPNDYWTNTGWQSPNLDLIAPKGVSAEEAWMIAAFLHDVPTKLATEALRRERANPRLLDSSLGPWTNGPT